MGPLERYIANLRDTRLSGEGVSELSYYPAVHGLLEEVGGGLKPKVRCFMNLKNRGAGLPDGGLFTADQVRGAGGAATDGLQLSLLGGQKPARGAIEVKSPAVEVQAVAASGQVLGYLMAYRQVLVTNLRDFLLLGLDVNGKPVELERFVLAASEAEFWSLTAHPRLTEMTHGARFAEFLKRVLLSTASLAAPQDLAWFLASYAREARALTESAQLPTLDAVRESMEEALGVKFEGAKGEHFFRSTLVQTLFYGLFASWVLWSKEHDGPGDSSRFDWKTAAWTLRVPVVKALFEQVATPSRLGALGLVPVLDRAAAALNRVDRAAFFTRFEQHHAVQYFYEPFLEAFDPELRKELGVWYTPPEIVQYMVARVDTVLREELGVPDGLADPRVYVLDPCCGTGAYLVEVLERIAQTLDEKGGDALSAGDVKKAALERVFGFEILPAPFVIAHMQLGLLLQNMHLPLVDQERVGVFLTNALTGWESHHRHHGTTPFPELEAERDAAEHVKQDLPILVILGNPPYNGFAGVSPEEEHGLVEVYKEGLVKEWGIKKFNLDDLYVRFFRLAERRIAEMTGKGVVCFISNFSYLSDPSFVVMRKRFLDQFDKIWIDCLNGDSRETGKKTPEGKPDPSVFSTGHNREGIRLGTAIGMTVRGSVNRESGPRVVFREFWGSTKRQDLLGGLAGLGSPNNYAAADPAPRNRFSFRPSGARTGYSEWPTPVELCSEAPVSGLQEMRRSSLIDIDREALESRMRLYLDPATSWDMLRIAAPGLTESAGRFDPAAAREKVLARETLGLDRVLPYALHPFDERWCYWSPVRPLWNEPRPLLYAQCWPGNGFLITRMVAERPHEQVPFAFTSSLPDYHLLRPNAVAIPVRLRRSPASKSGKLDLQGQFPMEGENTEPIANLCALARGYLTELGVTGIDSTENADVVWMHILGVGYSSNYLTENGDEIRQDWPRIPLPNSKALLLASAELGRKVADLLDPESDVNGVTAGDLRPELKTIGAPSRVGAGPLNEGIGDFAVTAGWGHAGQGGVTMPGKGKAITRPYTSEELAAIGQGAEALGLSLEEALAQLGETTLDVYLNDVAYWRCVPSGVWSYTIGGYQVMKKWLSYREKALLGRDLKVEEVREVMRMARRIAAILLLQPALDANYEAVKASTWSWNPRHG